MNVYYLHIRVSSLDLKFRTGSICLCKTGEEFVPSIFGKCHISFWLLILLGQTSDQYEVGAGNGLYTMAYIQWLI